MEKFLATGYNKSKDITINNCPFMSRLNKEPRVLDIHWIVDIYFNIEKGSTVDYLEYTEAKDSYASLYDLPRRNIILSV